MSHQDNRTLEERIATDLYQLDRNQRPDFRPWSSIGHEARAPYLRYATHCTKLIRQVMLTQSKAEINGPASTEAQAIQLLKSELSIPS